VKFLVLLAVNQRLRSRARRDLEKVKPPKWSDVPPDRWPWLQRPPRTWWEMVIAILRGFFLKIIDKGLNPGAFSRDRSGNMLIRNSVRLGEGHAAGQKHQYDYEKPQGHPAHNVVSFIVISSSIIWLAVRNRAACIVDS